MKRKKLVFKGTFPNDQKLKWTGADMLEAPSSPKWNLKATVRIITPKKGK